MSRRRSAADSDPDPPLPAGTVWLPRLVFLLLSALILSLGVLEVRNRLNRPVLWRIVPPRPEVPALLVYQKGGAAERTAWVLHEAGGKTALPQLVQRLACDGGDHRTGDLCWTADGQAFYAVHREKRSPDGGPLMLWLFEFQDARLFVSDPAFALPGALSILEEPGALQQRLRRHGEPGFHAAAWYDINSRGTPLWFWQTTRWEGVLPHKR